MIQRWLYEFHVWLQWMVYRERAWNKKMAALDYVLWLEHREKR